MRLQHSFSLHRDEVRIYDCGTSPEFNLDLISAIENARPHRSSKCRADLRGNCPPDIESEMTRIFEQAFTEYVNELFQPELWANFDFFADWSINLYQSGTATFTHTHNEAFLTLIYYPQTCEGRPQTTFTSSLLPLRTGEIVISNPCGLALWDRYAKEDARLPTRFLPKEGFLLVMPGYLPHWTVPGEWQKRISLAAFIIAKQKSAKLIPGKHHAD